MDNFNPDKTTEISLFADLVTFSHFLEIFALILIRVKCAKCSHRIDFSLCRNNSKYTNVNYIYLRKLL